jgi:uncharacterized protein YecT (DUF1311 family)
MPVLVRNRRSGARSRGAPLALLALAAIALARPAGAQPLPQPEGEVRTCEAFANRLFKRERAGLLPVTIEWERGLGIDPIAGSVGRQKLTTVLHGLASFASEAGRGHGRFLCVLAGPGRAVFFHLLPASLPGEADPIDPLRACGETDGEMAACLAQRLTQAEQAVEAAVAASRTSLRRVEQGSGRTGLLAAFDAAQAGWRTWRDATCTLEALEADPQSAAASFDQACRIRTAAERVRALAPR